MLKQVVTSVVLSAALLLTLSSSVGQTQGLSDLSTSYTLADVPKLEPEAQHKAASRRIASYFTRYHYSRVELDEAMAEQIFNRYFEQLDYNRMFFLQSDIDEFASHRKNFHEKLLNGDLDAAYAMHQRNLQRRFERFQYALSVVESGIEFDEENIEFQFDRTKADWATTRSELDDIWHQRVLNDALNLLLAGRTEDEITDNLKRRYRSALQQLTQTQSEDAFQNVMNAFARSVDAHTSYLSPRNAERFQQNMNLSLEGIGAVLQAEFDYTVIRSLVPGGPADKSGKLSPDDRIIAVAQGDQEFVDIIGWRLDDVVEIIKGPKGSVVRLQVLKGGDAPGASPVEVEIIREEVRLEDREAKLSYETADSGERFAVITIPGFYNKLTDKVQELLVDVRANDVDGLIIDLRGNGGGALNESITLTGLFIPSGPVVQVRDSTGRIDVSGDPDPQVHYDGPMVVMIDRFSASASEIFAAALQDYQRALIVGENSFGKGTVQQHRGLARRFDLHSNPMGSVQYTMAKFYRIDGGSTQHKGVVPDIQFPSLIDPEEFGESRAENALPWDQIEAVEFRRFNYVNTDVIERLNNYFGQRTATDPEFSYIHEDAERVKAMRNRTHVSLVKAEREAESERDRQRSLDRINERLLRAGLEPVETIDEADEEVRTPDVFLAETLRISADYLRILRENN